ncbi:hypothetical protein ANAPC1_01361 [Anaplasma phagocytophilum]|uniref:Uncharacterized protein n=3 Tax=Anaplasma phagocytophilum TaxID=948 RepID=A0AA45ZHW1_ANAPH|nr:hypothetical protein [Anaplasma phagocytophilum]ANC34591.1 hypothetical protein P029_04615 [Anaplasma phagocytophilum str. Norway variant2]KJV67586.1 hypothetical protein APHNP_0725 [Anaplasma phagocytophilum str. ApNP]SBO14593.1 hypothetical protein ANAPC1_00952 [Anaplasma phagocytophilum]SBO14983.1 hypothetical protein ANAPC1_01361 [Anaplasma phagocytophilum]SCV63208.1 hypothetical protein ANAPH2_00564 [Anaplasma phagocytophilum]
MPENTLGEFESAYVMRQAFYYHWLLSGFSSQHVIELWRLVLLNTGFCLVYQLKKRVLVFSTTGFYE